MEIRLLTPRALKYRTQVLSTATRDTTTSYVLPSLALTPRVLDSEFWMKSPAKPRARELNNFNATICVAGKQARRMLLQCTSKLSPVLREASD